MISSVHSWMRSSPVGYCVQGTYTVVHFLHWQPVVFIWGRVSHQTASGCKMERAVKTKTNSDWWNNQLWWNIFSFNIRYVPVHTQHSMSCFSVFSWDNGQMTVHGWKRCIYKDMHRHAHSNKQNKQTIGHLIFEHSGIALVSVRQPVSDRLRAISVN